MLQKIFFMGMLFGVAFLVLKKDKEEILLNNKTNEEINLKIENLECTPQLFVLKGNIGGEIIGFHGTELTFSPNSFMDAEGVIIKDSIDIQLIEYHLKGKDGTFYIPEARDDSSILTNGTFELMAFYNDEPIMFNPDIDLESILLK